MHDVPYVQSEKLGPETVACMTRVAVEVKQVLKDTKIPCGVQVIMLFKLLPAIRDLIICNTYQHYQKLF